MEITKIDITEKVDTFRDVMEIYLEKNTLTDLQKVILESIPTHPFDVAGQASLQLYIIANVLNEGWVPDWTSTSEYKWYPCFVMSPFYSTDVSFCNWHRGSDFPSLMVFKEPYLARFAGTKFIEIYKAAFKK